MIHSLQKDTVVREQDECRRVIRRQVSVKPLCEWVGPHEDHSHFYMRTGDVELSSTTFVDLDGCSVVLSDILILGRAALFICRLVKRVLVDKAVESGYLGPSICWQEGLCGEGRANM